MGAQITATAHAAGHLFLQQLNQLWHGLEQVGNQVKVAHLMQRRLGIRIDGADDLRHSMDAVSPTAHNATPRHPQDGGQEGG